jgi:flagellar basal body-associated protein FliL
MLGLLKSIYLFYYEGFKNLTNTSKKLWILIIIKSTLILIVLFLFFPDVLSKYETDEQKSEVVADSLLNSN